MIRRIFQLCVARRLVNHGVLEQVKSAFSDRRGEEFSELLSKCDGDVITFESADSIDVRNLPSEWTRNAGWRGKKYILFYNFITDISIKCIKNASDIISTF